jgi:predicted ABC-type ATPase
MSTALSGAQPTERFPVMSVKKPQVIVIAGPNGAGKTTLASSLLQDTFGVLKYVNADPIALGLSAFDPASVSFEAGRIMLDRLHTLAQQRKDFAFETTLASRHYSTWISGLRATGYDFHLLFLWLCSADLAIERVAQRVRSGGHFVPAEVVRRRYRRGLANLTGLYHPVADTWVIYDNSETGSPLLVAAGGEKIPPRILQGDTWQRVLEAQYEG